MRHVIAVADEGQLQSVQAAEMLLHREHVGQRLAGMIKIAQRVDHRHARPARQFIDGGLRENARDDALGPAIQIAGDIFHRLAFPDGAGGDHGIAAELLDGELEGHAGAQRRLFEQQSKVAAGQRLSEARGSALDLGSEIQHASQLVTRKIEVGGEVAGSGLNETRDGHRHVR